MIFLIDCNSFFASCEKVFRPELKDKPVIVLSNNDGCVVARSKEAKKLNIPMAAPYFQIKDIVKKYKVNVFSSNYTLYGDISARIMKLLTTFTTNVEIYSIDEAFVEIKSNSEEELYNTGIKIKNTIYKHIGIPVSIGISTTKTLAKLLCKEAKNSKSGVCISKETKFLDNLLKFTELNEIWGISRGFTERLQKIHINNGYEFKYAKDYIIKQIGGVTLLRVQKELNQIKAIEFGRYPSLPKSMVESRSFRVPITNYKDLLGSISNHMVNATKRLRKNNLCTQNLIIFISTSRFKPNRYKAFEIQTFTYPTSNTLDLIHSASIMLKKIYRSGYEYKKSGIMFTMISSERIHQNLIFEKCELEDKNYLFNTVDKINNEWGRNIIKPATCMFQKTFSKSELISPRYTTRWEDIPHAKTN